MAGKRHFHTEAVVQARDDMKKVIEGFDSGFMLDKASPKTERRRELLDNMAPDLQQMAAEGMPAEMLERLARMDMD